MSDMTVANTILDQLGGKRFLVMTGAKNLVGDSDSLMFKLPRNGKDGSNKWKITLTPMDVYHVETYFVRGTTFRKCSDFDDIYAENLVDLFERTSGFRTKL